MITAFVNFLIRKGALDKEYQETSVYGLTLLVEKVVTYLLLSGLALFMGKLAEGLVFAVCFVCLRQATGGFHAKTFLGCLAGSAVSFFIAVEVLAAWLDRCPLAVAVLLVLSIFCVVVWAPVNHPNLLLTEEEMKKNRLWSRMILFIETVTVMLGYFLHRQWQQYIVSAVILCAVFILIAKIMRQEVKITAMTVPGTNLPLM